MPVSGFVTREPFDRRPATEQTRFAVAFDERALYFRLELADSQPQRGLARLTRRDADSASDWVHVWLATDGDKRYAYRFSVNPARVKQDARIADGVNEDLAWDARWQAAVKRHSGGWNVELRIPFDQLSFDPRLSRWGIQVARVLERTREHSYFSPYPRASTQLVRHFGVLSGLDLPPSVSTLDITPYVRTDVSFTDGERDAHLDAGGDLRLRLSPELSLHATVNPDFGQVEADPSELNLTVFETFLPERRAFFVEEREAFEQRIRFDRASTETLYYSRRIGQAPRTSLGYDAEDFVERPQRATIAFASKLAGRTASGLTVGMLQAVTNAGPARVRSADGRVARRDLEPWTQYGVLRLAQTLNDGRTAVSGMLTGVARDMDAELWSVLPRTAVGAGVDVDHRVGNVHVLGKVFGTEVSGSAQAIRDLQTNSVHNFQRADAPHLAVDPERTTLSGYGFTLAGAKLSGNPWRAAWGGTVLSPGLDPNDLGYLQRADERTLFTWVQYRQDEPTPTLRSFTLDTNTWLYTTYGEEVTGLGANATLNVVFANHTFVYVGSDRQARSLDPRVLRGGPALLIPGRGSIWAGAGTDDRRLAALDVNLWAGAINQAAAQWAGAQMNGRVRPWPSLELALIPRFEQSMDGYAWVDEGETESAPIVGRLERTTASVTLRTTWALTPDLTFQLYAMPYVSAGTYATFLQVVDPRARVFEDHFAAVDYGGDERFLFSELRTNAVVRWEYEPGSAAYLVWSHAQGESRSDRGRLVAGRDLESLLGAPSDDVILLKVTRLFAR
jgi:hypothetical protein